MGIEKIVLISFIVALIEMDNFFIGMTLLSQPIISGALAGLFFNNISTGIFIGTIVQLIWIFPPVGAFVPPSASAITVSTTVFTLFLFDVVPEVDKNSAMMFCLIIGVSFGYFVGQMDIWNRKLNTIIMHGFENQILQGNVSYIFLIQLFSFLAKYLRDVIGYLALFVFGIPLAIKIFLTLPVQILFGLKMAFWIIPVLGMAVIFNLFETRAGAIFHGLILSVFYFIFAFYRKDIHYFLILVILIAFLLIYNSIWKEGKIKS
jgi:mannose/fructose/N-acetylgalactosamine-specific phosphotransferase system component IIC